MFEKITNLEEHQLPAVDVIKWKTETEVRQKEYVSKGYIKETETHLFYNRNYRYGEIQLVANKKEQKLQGFIKTYNNVKLAYLIVQKNKILFWGKNEGFKQGFTALNKFSTNVARLYPVVDCNIIFTNYYNDDRINRSTFSSEETLEYIFDFVKCLGFNNLLEVCLPLLRDNPHNFTPNKYPTSNTYSWTYLRKHNRLKDLTYAIFKTRGNSYTSFVQKLLTLNTLIYLDLTIILSLKLKLNKEIVKSFVEDFVNKHDSNIQDAEEYYEIFKINKKQFNKCLRYIDRKVFTKNIKYFTDLHNLYHTVGDICRMSENTIPKKENKWIKSLNLNVEKLHDVLIRYNTENRKLIKQKEYILPHYSFFKPFENFKLSNGFEIILPKTTKDLIEWGIHNNICIGYYDKKMIDGTSYCLSLQKNNIIYCIEIAISRAQDKLVIIQHAGKHNNLVDQEILEVFQNECLKKIKGAKFKAHKYEEIICEENEKEFESLSFREKFQKAVLAVNQRA